MICYMPIYIIRNIYIYITCIFFPSVIPDDDYSQSDVLSGRVYFIKIAEVIWGWPILDYFLPHVYMFDIVKPYRFTVSNAALFIYFLK